MLDETQALVLDTLLLPFRTGILEPTTGAVFLRARPGSGLAEVFGQALTCEQPFKPDAEALAQAGFDVARDVGIESNQFSLALVLPPRQREEARALLARAVRLVGPEGLVIAASANNAGARTHEADLERLCGRVESLSKNKCRVYWSVRDATRRIDAALLAEWLQLDAPRPILEGRFVSRPGVFAWDRIDAASELLAAELPAALEGHAADLGAGFGYLSSALLQRCAGIAALDVYEADARALELARSNLAVHSERVAIDYRWHDVTSGLPRRYDVIVTNPPFHTSTGRDDPGLGRRFIQAAAAALNPGGRLFLVANRHLPYEGVLNANFGSVRIAAQRYGFKIIAATRALASAGR